MKSNYKNVLFIAPALVFITFTQTPISAITSAKSSSTELPAINPKDKSSLSKTKKAETSNASEENLIPTAEQDKLAKLAQIFQERPDDNTYGALWENFVAFTQQQLAEHKDPSYLFKSWKALSQAGLKIIDPIGSNNAIHVYTFNRIAQNTGSFVPQTKYALVQWNEQSATAPAIAHLEHKSSKKTWTRKPRTIVVMKAQSISVPNYVDVKEVSLLPHILSTNTSAKVSTKAAAKRCKTNKGNNSSNHFLAILGTDLQSGHIWLLGLKQSSAGWANYSDLFQDIPSFLVQTNSTKIKFSGNTLIITMGGAGGYELIMLFIDDHFAFSTKEAQDSANAVARQFLLAIQYKRMDLTRVWLSDPKLASIPAYLGLFNRSNDSPSLRLINMPPPLCGGSRFRLITSNKNDLIIDVAKIKGQWLIKALFIAPSNLISGVEAKGSSNGLN
jgi:hypothetical protein